MTEQNMPVPDYLFEVSWEVCNKVGGIYTVIASKTPNIKNRLKNNYILIGPDILKEARINPDFTEDKYLFKSWRDEAEKSGLKFKVGNWNIPGKPIAFLVDFTQYFAEKDEILSKLWETYKVDSYSGQWDYVEPALFGIAAARVIQSFYDYHVSSHDHVVAQFHEWMTGAGILYLKSKCPQIASVFTTHATVLGRSIAGNGMPLYDKLKDYDSESLAKTMNIVSKYSLEKSSANFSDCFTTVSEITANECVHFLDKAVDVITPNGFDDSLVPESGTFDEKRKKAKEVLRTITEGLINQSLDENTVYLLNSGRYEFHNKGIDLFIDALGQLNKQESLEHNIVACIAIPAYHAGPSHHLLERIEKHDFSEPVTGDYCTHFLHNYDSDAMISRIKTNNLNNATSDKVKIVIIPCYLDGKDGIVNLTYYDFLIGFDLTVFPSYYEPWGYTPLESIAFHIPTITTTLAGFGQWVLSKFENTERYISIIDRTDDNDLFVVNKIAENILTFINSPEKEREHFRKEAFMVSRYALWEELSKYYFDAYTIAMAKADQRYELYKGKVPHSIPVSKPKELQTPSWKKILIRPNVPESLSSLSKLTRNLWWTWNNEAQDLFEMINPELWKKYNFNPIALLGSLTLDDYRKLQKNQAFLNKLEEVNNSFCSYMSAAADKPKEKVAYFSMEFGLHDSIKTYSGGLGILAGDFLKEASDSNVNITGVSLLYRYGYFNQHLSMLGDQIETYSPQKYSLLPLLPVRHESPDGNGNGNNNWVKVRINAPGRTIVAKVWRVDVGRVCLYLLDTDIDENQADDRIITHRLYGGDTELRFKQELLLGVGGIRLLSQLGIEPEIYHCNEGHAAFMGVERLHKLVREENLMFSEAIEVVRASTIFTTHTPVPAGHDTFSEDLLRTYIPHYAERLKISWDTFINLGKTRENDKNEPFNMSMLASHLSSRINGVSRKHGEVTRKMFAALYPGYFPEELHIGYVTNGVHFPTWVAKRWKELYDKTFDEKYLSDQSNPEYWKKIHDVPDEAIWKIRQHLRGDLIKFVKDRLMQEMTLRQDNPEHIFEVAESLNDKTLTIGFARRFATYKRAQLLFKDPERLAAIVNNKDHPVQFIYAGKAHPNDGAGQELIKKIYLISQRPEFVGKIVFVENYDINLGKKLTQGVDIWLNTPTRPQEASGTSGEKAVMNGVINFSVLDGWWAEGYCPEAGWALKEERTYQNQDAQDALDAATIYNMLEDEIIPMFYKRNKQNTPEAWVKKIKNTIAMVAPHYTMKRMMDDYYAKFYTDIFRRSQLLKENDYKNARKLSAWKQKMLRGWDSIEVVSLKTTDSDKKPLGLGEKFYAELVLHLNELDGDDIGVELLFGQKDDDVVDSVISCHEMPITRNENNMVTFYFGMPANKVGVFDYAIRVYPKNILLAHRQEFSLMKWL